SNMVSSPVTCSSEDTRKLRGHRTDTLVVRHRTASPRAGPAAPARAGTLGCPPQVAGPATVAGRSGCRGADYYNMWRYTSVDVQVKRRAYGVRREAYGDTIDMSTQPALTVGLHRLSPDVAVPAYHSPGAAAVDLA